MAEADAEKSGRRRVRFARALLGAAIAAAAIGAWGPGTQSARAGSLDELGAACPVERLSGFEGFSNEEIVDAKQYRFEILDQPVTLQPDGKKGKPIDWDRDDDLFSNLPARKKLNTLVYLDPLLYAYDRNGRDPGFGGGGDTDALMVAAEVAYDWVRDHPESTNENVKWERKRSGDRGERIAYITRAAACEGGILSENRLERMLDSSREHGNFLYRTGDSSKGPTNHGLLRDLGLVVIAEYMDFLGRAQDWRARAIERFTEGIAHLVDTDTGVHLEHTPGYQEKTVRHLEDFLEALGAEAPAELQTLLAKMRDVAAWFVFHDDFTVPIADTPFTHKSPQYAVDGVGGKQSLAPGLFRSGYGIVRQGVPTTNNQNGSYFATAAQFHNGVHKHTDELTFNLFEDGLRLIVDTGRRNSKQDGSDNFHRIKEFTQSAHAHSTVIADGRSFDEEGKPYGSALVAQGSGGGWHAIEGKNPLIRRQQGVRHRRLFLYKPGEVLVVSDELDSGKRHNYGRYFQIGPQIDAAIDADSRDVVHLSCFENETQCPPSFDATIWNEDLGRNRGPRLYYGNDDPFVGWWVPPGLDDPEERFTLKLRSKARDIEHLTTIGVGSQQPVTAREVADGVFCVDDQGLLGNDALVTVQRSGGNLAVQTDNFATC